MTILQSSFSNQNSFGSSQRSSVAVWAPVLFLVNHGEDSKRRDWFWLMCLEVQVSDDCVVSQALRRSRTLHREKQQLYSPLSPFPKKIQSCGSTLMGPPLSPQLITSQWTSTPMCICKRTNPTQPIPMARLILLFPSIINTKHSGKFQMKNAKTKCALLAC